MSKIKITKAMVDAVEQFLYSSAPSNYDKMTPEQQLRARREAVRKALLVASQAASHHPSPIKEAVE